MNINLLDSLERPLSPFCKRTLFTLSSRSAHHLSHHHEHHLAH